MALKKLSISEEQAEMIRVLVSNGATGVEISARLNIPQSTLWRNMEFMGVNRKKKKNRIENGYFNLENFFDNYRY